MLLSWSDFTSPWSGRAVRLLAGRLQELAAVAEVADSPHLRQTNRGEKLRGQIWRPYSSCRAFALSALDPFCSFPVHRQVRGAFSGTRHFASVGILAGFFGQRVSCVEFFRVHHGTERVWDRKTAGKRGTRVKRKEIRIAATPRALAAHK